MVGLSARFRGVGEEWAQLVILTKHFFERLFRNDIVDFEDQMKARLVAVLSILAVVMGWSSQMLLFFKYELSAAELLFENLGRAPAGACLTDVLDILSGRQPFQDRQSLGTIACLAGGDLPPMDVEIIAGALPRERLRRHPH